MKLGKILAASAMSVFTIVSYSAMAEMRPECGEDPDKPGACFFNVIPGGILTCEDGAILWPPYEEEVKRSFGRENPNGKIAIHLTAGAVPGFACTAEDAAGGFCPGIGVYSGWTNLQVNGFITPGGGISCPYRATAQGTLFRANAGYDVEEIDVDVVVHVVKDKRTGTCRPQRCRIFAVE